MLYREWLVSFYRTVRLCFWIALIALAVLWAISTLSWPYSRDQGILAWAGSVVRDGGVLYRDAWDVKGPIAVVPFVITQSLFGRNMWGIRLLDLLITLINLAALSFAALRFWDRTAAKYALVLGVLFAMWLNFAITAQPDEWCGCAVTIVVALVSTAKREVTPRIVATGAFLIGLCVLQKPVYAVFILLFMPFINRSGRAIRTSAVAAAIGLSVPIIAALIYFQLHHAVGDLFDTYLLFNLRTHLQLESSPADQIRLFLYCWQAFLPLSTGVPLAVFGAVILSARNLRFGALFVLWFLLNVVIIIIQGKYFEYQWVPLITPVALGAGVALRQLRDFKPAAATAVLLTFVLLFINSPLRSVKAWALYRTGSTSRDDYDARFVYLYKNHYDFLAIRRLATYIQDHSSTSDTLQVWGFDVGINYLANRAAPSRFGYTYPLQIGAKNPHQQGYREEFLGRLHDRPPLYVLVPSNDAFGLTPVPSDRSFNDFTELRDFVHDHYATEKTMENWTIYRLR